MSRVAKIKKGKLLPTSAIARNNRREESSIPAPPRDSAREEWIAPCDLLSLKEKKTEGGGVYTWETMARQYSKMKKSKSGKLQGNVVKSHRTQKKWTSGD